jgi:hypothetical protein
MAKKEAAHVEVAEKSVEDVMAESGIDVAAAKASLARLKRSFSVGVGGIPEAALRAWINESFSGSNTFWMAVGRSWEKGA